MSIRQEIRTFDDIELPPAGTYRFDPAHTAIIGIARHLMFTKVRGRFNAFSGAIEVGDRPETSSVTVTIEAASIDTANEGRDAHLRSPDFLDVEAHPFLTFTSTRVVRTGERELEITGDLTIRGITHPVTLYAELEGMGPDESGGTRVALSARAQIDRELWGMTWNQALETGGVLVGRKIDVELEVAAVGPAS